MNTTIKKKKMENEGRIVELLTEALIKIDESSKRLDGLAKDMRKVNLKLQELNLSVLRLADLAEKQEKRLDKIEERIDRMEVRLDRIDERIGRMEVRLDRIDERSQRNDARIFKLETA